MGIRNVYLAKEAIVSWLHCRFVDGEAYFDGVADALESAEEEIFITGWW